MTPETQAIANALAALKAAIKEIEYLHNMMRRTTASGICVSEQCKQAVDDIDKLGENNED